MNLTRQQIGEAADELNWSYDFDKHPGFTEARRERVRVIYNWLRDQEKKPKAAEATTLIEYREVAARIWCDPAMSMKVMDTNVAEWIALLLAGLKPWNIDRVISEPLAAPPSVAEPAASHVVQSPSAG